MIAPATIIARLKDQCIPGPLRDCGGAGDLSTAMEQMNISKRAFVVPGNEKAEGNSTGSFYISQRVAVSFTVFFGLSLVNDPMGAKALDQVVTVREAIKAALVGWLPDGEDEPLQYSDGTISDIDPRAGFIIYGLTFFNRYELRS